MTLVTELKILGQVLNLSESQFLHPSTTDIYKVGTQTGYFINVSLFSMTFMRTSHFHVYDL